MFEFDLAGFVWTQLERAGLASAGFGFGQLGLARHGSNPAALHAAIRLGLATVSWARLSWNFLGWVGSAWLGLVVWHVWSRLVLAGLVWNGHDWKSLGWPLLSFVSLDLNFNWLGCTSTV